MTLEGYTKLFPSIIASTIWDEPNHVRIVWITMLALSGPRGEVAASVPGLAHLARVTREECEEALAVLMAPDPYSRTKDHDGRRIEEIEGGWRILNREKYRDMMSAEYRREYKRRWDAENRPNRNRKKRKPDTNPTKPDKTRHNPTFPIQTETEIKRERELSARAREDAAEEAETGGERDPVRELFEALAATGKMPNLTFEHLSLAARAHPRADIRDPETLGEIVASAQSVTGAINHPFQWIKRRLSDIEARRTAAPADGKAQRVGVRIDYADPNDPLLKHAKTGERET